MIDILRVYASTLTRIHTFVTTEYKALLTYTGLPVSERTATSPLGVPTGPLTGVVCRLVHHVRATLGSLNVVQP